MAAIPTTLPLPACLPCVQRTPCSTTPPASCTTWTPAFGRSSRSCIASASPKVGWQECLGGQGAAGCCRSRLSASRACRLPRIPTRHRPAPNPLHQTGADILDLGSSWVSHLPAEKKFGRVVGHGMNAAELARNPQLDEFFVRNLNESPRCASDRRGSSRLALVLCRSSSSRVVPGCGNQRLGCPLSQHLQRLGDRRREL